MTVWGQEPTNAWRAGRRRPPKTLVGGLSLGALAARLIEDDENGDRYRDERFQLFVARMSAEPAITPEAMSLILVARNLERVEDPVLTVGREPKKVAATGG